MKPREMCVIVHLMANIFKISTVKFLITVPPVDFSGPVYFAHVVTTF